MIQFEVKTLKGGSFKIAAKDYEEAFKRALQDHKSKDIVSVSRLDLLASADYEGYFMGQYGDPPAELQDFGKEVLLLAFSDGDGQFVQDDPEEGMSVSCADFYARVTQLADENLLTPSKVAKEIEDYEIRRSEGR